MKMKIQGIFNNVDIAFIRKEMKKKGIRQKDIAEKLQMSKGQVSDTLNPNGRNPLSSKLAKIAYYVAVEELKDEIE